MLLNANLVELEEGWVGVLKAGVAPPLVVDAVAEAVVVDRVVDAGVINVDKGVVVFSLK